MTLRARDVAELLMLSAVWGGSFLFMRIAAPALGPLPVSAGRVAVAAFLLLAVLALRGGTNELRSRAGALVLVGALNSAIPFALLAYATLSLTAGFAAILNTTSPLWGGVIAHFWLRERLTPLRALGLAVGLTGVVLLVWDKASLRAGSGLPIGAVLLASVCYGVGVNYTKRYATGASPLAVAAGSQLAATLLLLPFAAASFPSQRASPGAWASVVALGVACTAFAYTLYFRLIKNIGPSRAITSILLVPLFATAWGSFFLGEAVTSRMVVGGLVTLFGTALATLRVGSRGAPLGTPDAAGKAARAR